MCVYMQGGLPLATVLVILRQTVAGLRHLHSLGILHRDLRAANVLVAANDPLRVVLADFGLSHLLSKAATLSTWVAVGTDGSAGSTPAAAHSVLSPSQASTFLTGDEALFPVEWNAPEVCVPTAKGTVASYATDVYMVGGFLYELLTGGTRPFAGVVKLAERRASRDSVQLELGVVVRGLYGVSVLELAAANGTPLPLCVRGVEGEAGAARLQACLDVLRDCVAMEPGARPSAATLESRLRALHDALVAEARAAGSDDGRGPATPLGGSRSPSPEAGYVAASRMCPLPAWHALRIRFACFACRLRGTERRRHLRRKLAQLARLHRRRCPHQVWVVVAFAFPTLL